MLSASSAIVPEELPPKLKPNPEPRRPIRMLANVVGPGHQPLIATILERPGRDQVERRAEDDEDEQRRDAAPRDEPPADAPDQPVVGGKRVEIGCVLLAGRDVRHASLRRYPTPRTVSIRDPSAPSFVRR